MRVDDPSQAGACQTLFLAPHAHDVPLSCALRLHGARAEGRRVLLAVAFGGVPEDAGWPALFERWGVDWLSLNLPAAAERDPAYRELAASSFGRAERETVGGGLGERLEQLLRVTRPLDVYLPLAVGGHVDHRLAHESGLACVRLLESANVFLYEERPPALLPGAVRQRLGQIGARLPPAAPLPAGAGLARAWLRFQSSPYLACAPAGRAERWRSSFAFARAWREARAWRPQRALGVRLQPVVHRGAEEALAPARQALEQWTGRGQPGGWSAARLLAASLAYEREFGPGPGAERYWLVLPERELEASGERLVAGS